METVEPWVLEDWKNEAYNLKLQLDAVESKLARVLLDSDHRIRDLVQQLHAADERAREAERKRDELQEELAAAKRELDRMRRAHSDLEGQ